MIQFDAPMAAIFITILLSLIAMGVAWGSLRERVCHNTEDIKREADSQKEVITQIRAEFKGYQINNREDHNQIFSKLDTILQNGKGKSE